MTAINLRPAPPELKRKVKIAAVAANKTMTEFCLEILAKQVGFLNDEKDEPPKVEKRRTK